MKKLVILSFLLASYGASFACKVCERQQPKPLRGITHGAGPQSEWDYLIVIIVSVIVIVSFFYAIRWLIFPGERDLSHIKNSILTLDDYE